MNGVDLSRLTIGLKASADLLVGLDHTAPRVGSGRVAVLATPVMINVMEAARPLRSINPRDRLWHVAYRGPYCPSGRAILHSIGLPRAGGAR